ncbi:MAG: hypothetical protein ABI832_09980 [bacterium]
MRVMLVLSLCVMTGPALAQQVFDTARGQYGSASDPNTSCAANPHQLDFMTSPPHALLTWERPKDGPPGKTRNFERYDVEDFDDLTMTLREEGDFRPDPEGGRFWVLQLTENPPGYCWRRPDWPQVRCEDQQLRCENATS